MKVPKTADDRISEIVEVARAFGTYFAENTPEQRQRFFDSWKAPQALAARVKLYWGLFEGAEDFRFVLDRVAKGKAEGWPYEFHRRAGDSPRAKQESDFQTVWESMVGDVVLRCFETGNAALLRKLAEAAEGKSEALNFSPRSDWKEKILRALLDLIESDPTRLPTKKALRESVAAMHRKTGKASEELDRKRCRDYERELGLSGLPSAKGTRSKQQRPPVDRSGGK